MKLSEKQKEVIRLMRDGWIGETAICNNESAYLFKTDIPAWRRNVNLKVFNNLCKNGLVILMKPNFALLRYHLSEKGKTIEL